MSAIASEQQKYGTVLTAAGKREIANAIAMNTKIDIKYVAVGDGAGAEYYPGEKQDNLKNQIYQTLANRVYIDPKNPNYVIVETYIPEDVGGFVIREACIKTKDETVIAIGNCPSSYKPVLPEGSSTGVYFKFVLEVTNASHVTINIDQSLIFATQEYVDNSVHHHSIETNVHGGTYLVKANRLMLRNEDGRCQIADPVEDKDATPKKWVLGLVASAALPKPYGDDGTTILMVAGAPAWLAASVPQNRRYITASTDFTAPVTGYYRVTCIGGGGGGGGSATTEAPTYIFCAGGGAGASGFRICKTVFLEAGKKGSCVVGAGGPGGAKILNGIAADGSNGGNTSFGTYFSAKGGGGGKGGEALIGWGIRGGEGSASGAFIGTPGMELMKESISKCHAFGGTCSGAFAENSSAYSRGGTGGMSIFVPGDSNAAATAGSAGLSGLLIVEW